MTELPVEFKPLGKTLPVYSHMTICVSVGRAISSRDLSGLQCTVFVWVWLGIGARKFRTNVQDAGDRSVWTDTPIDRLRKKEVCLFTAHIDTAEVATTS